MEHEHPQQENPDLDLAVLDLIFLQLHPSFPQQNIKPEFCSGVGQRNPAWLSHQRLPGFCGQHCSEV